MLYCIKIKKSGVAKKYLYDRKVQDMYEGIVTTVRFAVGMTDEFKVKMGLHNGSALSPFLFAIVMNRLTDGIRQETPLIMMFVDNNVICNESRQQVEANLKRWRYALMRREMKVSRSKTEYIDALLGKATERCDCKIHCSE